MEILKLLSHNILVEEEKIVENEITNNEEAKDFFNSIIDEVLKKEKKNLINRESQQRKLYQLLQEY